MLARSGLQLCRLAAPESLRLHRPLRNAIIWRARKSCDSAGAVVPALNSGSVTTTNANDLLVGADVIAYDNGSSGSGYTQRPVTTHDDIAEDMIVTTTGSYSATATQAPSGWWTLRLADQHPRPEHGKSGSARYAFNLESGKSRAHRSYLSPHILQTYCLVIPRSLNSIA